MKKSEEYKWVLRKLLFVEGDHVNDRMDPGGETYMGISRVYNPDWPGWAVLSDDKPDKLLLYKLVSDFYYDHYWKPMKCETISVVSKEVACRMMNIGINKNPWWAILWLQEALNLLNINEQLYPDLEEDGLIGPKTIRALKSYFFSRTPSYEDKVDMITGIMRTLQCMSYIKSMRKFPYKEKYRGWFLRAERASCR